MQNRSANLVRIRPTQAEIGMYVSAFHGSWLSHPFWRARFVITTSDHLRSIRDGGTDLYIDPTKGTWRARGGPALPVRPSRQRAASAVRASPRAVTVGPDSGRNPPLPTPARARPTFGSADKARAAALAKRSAKVVRALFVEARVGRVVPGPVILGVVQDIAEELERSSTAFARVTRLKSKHDGIYTHCVAVCALMINLAKERNADKEQVRDLGLAGLLHDIGKSVIDEAILNDSGDQGEDATAMLRRHAEVGHAILKAEPGIPAVALDVCLYHHEQIDGSGYPFGLVGDEISEAAKMAAICNSYDSLTSDRAGRKGLSPLAAIEAMEASEGRFDRDILLSFMRSIGVYPSGYAEQ